MTATDAWRNAIESLCQKLGWEYSTQETVGYLAITCPLPNDACFSGALFVVSEAAGRLMLALGYRKTIAPDNLPAALNTVAALNFGLLGGCLELNPEDGEIRYRDSLLLLSAEAPPDMLRAFVATTLRNALTHCADALFESAA